MLVFFTNVSLMEFLVIYLALFGLFSLFGLIWSVFHIWPYLALGGSQWKSSEEYPVNTGVSQSSVLVPTLFLLYMNDVPDDATIILLSMLIILPSTLSVIRSLTCGSN